MINEIKKCEIIIENSYDVRLNNFHQANIDRVQGFKNAHGYYLVLKKHKNKENSLTTLLLSIKKSLLKIYAHEIKQFGDDEFYETMSYSELFYIFKELKNKHGFEYIKEQFKSNESINKFCSHILTEIVNRNIAKLRSNTTNVIAKKVKDENGKQKWEYEKIYHNTIEKTISTKTENNASCYDVALRQDPTGTNDLHLSGIYKDSYFDEELNNDVASEDNIINYILKNKYLLTSTQREYLELGVNDDRKMNLAIRNRIVKKLRADRNIIIKLDEKDKLKSIELNKNQKNKNKLYKILKLKNNELIFKEICKELKLNNIFSTFLLDCILESDRKYYSSIFDYIKTEELNNDYLDNEFNHIKYKLKLKTY